jgi:alpha-maltose-1-phosphate synthase
MDREIRHRCCSFPYIHAFLAATARFGFGQISASMNSTANRAFDRWVARRMEPADVFMAMSGLGLQARRSAKAMGSLTVCDRGSTHIRYQDRILKEEFDRWKMPYKPIDPVIATEEAEYQEADVVVAQSTFAYKSFADTGFPPNRLAWLSPGVDLSVFFPRPRTDSKFRVLFIGQIGLRKGIPYLLQAMDSLADSNTELVLAGGMMPEARALLSPFEGRFRYAGRLDRKADLQDLYTQSSVLVLPSIEDGFGLVLNEAMACGIPVIASTNTGGPDLIDDGTEGFVVPIRSAEALADRLNYLREHSASAGDMGRQALMKAQEYSWDAYGARVVDLYRRTLALRASSS